MYYSHSKMNMYNYLLVIAEIFLQTFWRARSRLCQNEILQEDMRLTAFFELYKICILLYRCDLKILAKNAKFDTKNEKIGNSIFIREKMLRIFG